MTWVGMNLLQPLNCLNVVGLGEQSCVHGRAKSSGLIFPAQVASSQTEGMRASDHGRGHNFSVLFHCNISVLCCLLSFSLIIPSSPDFGCIYLLFPHPFILLPLSFTFNPHPFILSSLRPKFLLHRPMFVRTERGSRFSGITLCVIMRYTEWWFLECFY